LSPYPLLFTHVLRRIPAERAHTLAATSMGVLERMPVLRSLLRRKLQPTDPRLEVHALGMAFPSPLGVAAGMDKSATWYEALGALGFGFVEVGTITAEPQKGKPKPRVWRLTDDRGLLNAMGFPNPGAKVAARRLRRRTHETIVGANIGKSQNVSLENAGADYRASVRELAPHTDFIVLNVSSPNTAGLRELQAVDQLHLLVNEVRAELALLGLSPPLLIKLAPDLSDDEIDEIADFATSQGLDGIIAVNTTLSRDGLTSDPAVLGNPGGVSGAPLKARSISVLRRLYARVGPAVTLVSVGGIDTPADAWDRILAGATLVQGHTGFVYGGPLWPKRLNDDLAARARQAGARTIQELVGAETRGTPAVPSTPPALAG
jgi:dihydroorotate dehydrogenase